MPDLKTSNTSAVSNSVTTSQNQGATQNQSHLKILVPAFCAGAIIGHKGKELKKLQAKTETFIKFSYDYYPGTYFRVVFIKGEFGNIFKAVKEIYMMKSTCRVKYQTNNADKQSNEI